MKVRAMIGAGASWQDGLNVAAERGSAESAMTAVVRHPRTGTDHLDARQRPWRPPPSGGQPSRVQHRADDAEPATADVPALRALAACELLGGLR